MKEIWAPECIIALFFILYLIRPFIKGLWIFDGLVWLPLLGLGIIIGLFPAYGFRPECIPLLLFAIVINIANIPALIFSAGSVQNEDFSDRNPLFSIPALVFLGAALVVMFAFSPKVPSGLTAEGVVFSKIQNEDQEYLLRIYAPAEAGGGFAGIRPLVFLIPPEAGSIPAVDRICAGLRDRGFTVISYSRRGFDLSAVGENGRRYFVSPAKIRAMWRAFRAGTRLKKANEQGKVLEAERLKDIEFLLPRIPALLALPDAALPDAENAGPATPGAAEKTPMILAGYGAGGSALVLLSESAGFTGRFGNVKGIVAVESRLWSAYRSDPLVFPDAPEDASWYPRLKAAISKWFGSIKTRRVTGAGPFPRPGLPLLCLVSDRALEASSGGGSAENPYRALLETLRNSPNPAALAAITGAGPLDYTGYLLSHPLYSFLFPGQREKAHKSADPAEDTADIICNFALMLLEQDAAAQARNEAVEAPDTEAAAPEPPESAEPELPPLIMPARKNISANVYIETWGMPDFLH